MLKSNCCDFNCYFLFRKETAYDVYRDKMRNPATFRQEVVKALVGKIVLTPHTNATYRIDSIVSFISKILHKWSHQ